MKILWLGHNLSFPPKGGALQRNYNLLRELAKHCEVHVLAFDQPATRPEGVAPEDCVKALSEFCASVQWVRLSSSQSSGRYMSAVIGLLLGKSYDFVWLSSREMSKRLERAVTMLGPDVIHADTLGLAQYFPLMNGVATVLNHHDVESCKAALRAENTRGTVARAYFLLESAKLLTAERIWCPKFDVNVVVSEDEKALLLSSCPGSNVSIVPNGVDTTYFSPRVDPGGYNILFCGSLDMHPNQEAMDIFFRRMWHRLTTLVPGVELYVVGRRPPEWLREIGDKDPRVHVTGFVGDVRPFFKKAAVCICPVVSGGGTRLKILDSLAMGVPVVSTSFAASGLSLDHGRHLLLADDPDQFVKEVARLLFDPSIRCEVGHAGAKRVNQVYSWTVVAHSILDAYDVALRQHLLMPSLK